MTDDKLAAFLADLRARAEENMRRPHEMRCSASHEVVKALVAVAEAADMFCKKHAAGSGATPMDVLNAGLSMGVTLNDLAKLAEERA